MPEILVNDMLTQLLTAVVPNDRVKTDSGDPISDYLDAKCDDVTISVNTTTHKLEVEPTFLATLLAVLNFYGGIRYGVETLTAGAIVDVTFSSDIGGINYLLLYQAYRISDGSIAFPIKLSQASDKFTIDLPDDCDLHYLAILL